jgi:hypothetical protein
MKTLDTLIPDIYELFDKGHECSEENLDSFAESLKIILRERLKAYGEERAATLRMSNIGKPDRQLWYEVTGEKGEPLPPEAKLKFLYGDIIESMMLLLAKEAGHIVTDEQKEVSVEGIVGHIDAKIDGAVVDVKSASDFAFRKFKDGTLEKDDPFGYIQQLSGYATAEGGGEAAFLAVNKVTGDLALLKVSGERVREAKTPERARAVKTLLDRKSPPERCFDAVPHNASGNMRLGTQCSYCPYKFTCWDDSNKGAGLRTFVYSSGPIFLTDVKKEPNVFEVT